jgi:hypothetical protein
MVSYSQERQHLAKYQKGVYFSGIKIYNNLPSNIKNASGDIMRFKKLLRHFLTTHYFYSLEEYYDRWYMW